MPTGSSEQYWTEFSVNDKDIEAIYGYLLERSEPTPTRDLVARMVEVRVAEEEKRRQQLIFNARFYQPRARYQPGQRLIFTAFDNAEGIVTGVRPSDNPRVAPFEVAAVKMTTDGSQREFATAFDQPHPLNQDRPLTAGGAELKPEQVLEKYGSRLEQVVVDHLSKDKEFIHQEGRWLLKGLLTPIHQGHRNLAEALIEQGNEAVSTPELVRVLELEPGKKGTSSFSLENALGQDPQFEDVGPRGERRWYLTRLEPPDAHAVSPILEMLSEPPVIQLPPELESLRAELEVMTEGTLAPASPMTSGDQFQLILTYPHRRMGTLPLNGVIRGFLPPFDNPRLKVTLIDGQTNNRMVGFAVRDGHYITGLKSLYESRKLHPGAILHVRPGAEPLSLILDYAVQRERSLWVRVAKAQAGHLTFAQEKRPVAHKYDEDMLVLSGDPAAVESVAEATRRTHTLSEWLVDVFPELAKLTSAGRVHAKTVFAAISFIKRATPAAVLAALADNRSFSFAGGGYFVLESVKDMVR